MGHFLTRQTAAQRAGITPEEVLHRPDLLRIGGHWLEEVYFAFQFDDRGIKRDLGSVVLALRKEYDDIEIADWLAQPNPELGFLTPLRWSAGGLDGRRLGVAAERFGPHHDSELPSRPGDDGGSKPPLGGRHAGRHSASSLRSRWGGRAARRKGDPGRPKRPPAREILSPGA